MKVSGFIVATDIGTSVGTANFLEQERKGLGGPGRFRKWVYKRVIVAGGKWVWRKVWRCDKKDKKKEDPPPRPPALDEPKCPDVWDEENFGPEPDPEIFRDDEFNIDPWLDNK